MQRRFEFQGASGEPIALTVHCREPPESQMKSTLTWQLDDAERSAAEQPAAAEGRLPSPSGGNDSGDSNRSAREPEDLIGLDIWPASIALCRYLANHPELVAGQEVLELGAGIGLVGLLCAALGAQQVLLTDYAPQVLSLLADNAAHNGLQQQCTSLRLDWHQPSASLAPEQHASWRLVVAADVLYASAAVQPFVATLKLVLHTEGVVLLGHQVRRAIVLDRATRLPRLEDSDEPLEKFKRSCAEAGLQLRQLSSREPCSNCDTDPMLLLAVGWDAARLAQLPLLPSEA